MAASDEPHRITELLIHSADGVDIACGFTQPVPRKQGTARDDQDVLRAIRSERFGDSRHQPTDRITVEELVAGHAGTSSRSRQIAAAGMRMFLCFN